MSALENLIAAAWGSPDLTPELIAAARAERDELVAALAGCVRQLWPSDDFDTVIKAGVAPFSLRVASDILAKHAPCQHERLNDHGDACLDCKAVYLYGRWQ